MTSRPHPLDALLRPRSIAIVGVSRDPSRQASINGSAVLESLTRFGFKGSIHLVHPQAREIAGRPAWPDITSLPETPDAIVLSLGAADIPAAIEASGRKGIGAAVVMAAGFSELGAGEGTRLEAAMKASARQHGLRICGPNGLGYLNLADGICAGYFPCLATTTPRAGGLAILTHSGAIGNSLVARAVDRGIGFSYVISAGNETNVTLADYIDYLIADANTRVIAIYMEGVVDGPALREALERSTRAGKPVVIYKVGKSAAGARAALSHTAKIAGEPRLYRGLFRQLGVIEAQCLDDLIEIPMLLLKSARFTSRVPRNIAVVTISGGLGAILADHFAAEGFALPELASSTQAALAALPLKFGSVANPVDTTAAIQRTEETLTDILTTVAQDPAIDAIVFPNASRFPDRAVNVAQIMRATAARIDKPLLSIWYAGTDNDAAMKLLHESAEVACYDDPAACARALAALREVRAFATRVPSPALTGPAGTLETSLEVMQRSLDRARRGSETHVRAPEQAAGQMNEPDAKALLRLYGVPVPREQVARNAHEAVEAVHTIGFPVAMKVVSAAIAHKARVGGVKLGLTTAAQVQSAHEAMLAKVHEHLPDVVPDGVLISEMVAIRAEFIVGAYVDAHLGPTLAVGIGGAQVEEIRDVAMRVLPVTRDDCRDALNELHDRSAKLLADTEREALVDAIARIATMAWALQPHLRELDVNPVALTSAGQVVALDAMMVFEDRDNSDQSRRH